MIAFQVYLDTNDRITSQTTSSKINGNRRNLCSHLTNLGQLLAPVAPTTSSLSLNFILPTLAPFLEGPSEVVAG